MYLVGSRAFSLYNDQQRYYRNQVSEMKLSEKGYKLIVKLYQLPFILVMRRTMLMLFPFAVLGSIASVFNVSILSRTGFIGNIFYITQWLPHVARIRQCLQPSV